MRSKIFKSFIGMLLGCFIACSIAVMNSPVTASSNQATKANPSQPTYISVVPVKPLDTGTYKDMAARAVVGDNLTPDHIPSFAAIKKYREKVQGGAITGAAETALRNSTNTIVYSGTIHQKFSRTYGGRNTEAQIAADGKDANSLKAAFVKDRDTVRPELIKSGLKAADVDKAFADLDALNKKIGLYQ